MEWAPTHCDVSTLGGGVFGGQSMRLGGGGVQGGLGPLGLPSRELFVAECCCCFALLVRATADGGCVLFVLFQVR